MSNPDRALTTLVVLDVVLSFTGIGAQIFFQWTLPGSLQTYAQSEPWWPTSPAGSIVFLLWGATVLATVVAWVGLLNSWWFARKLYLAAWTSWVLVVLVSGASVLNPVGATVATLQPLGRCAILGLVYFSDLARRFERKPATVTNGAAVTT